MSTSAEELLPYSESYIGSVHFESIEPEESAIHIFAKGNLLIEKVDLTTGECAYLYEKMLTPNLQHPISEFITVLKEYESQ